MINDLKAERALVMFKEPGNTTPPPIAAYGLEGDVWTDPTVPSAILKHCLAYEKPVLLVDMQQEKRLASSECSGSSVCVPLEQGLLYCDHPTAGRLDQQALNSVKTLAEDFDRRREALARESRQERKPAPQVKERRRLTSSDYRNLVTVLLGMFAVTALGVILWLVSLISSP